MGHTAELARNGQEALEKIATALLSALEAEVSSRIAFVRRVVRAKNAHVRGRYASALRKLFHTQSIPASNLLRRGSMQGLASAEKRGKLL